MPIRIQCPGCKKGLSVKDHLAGKRVLCPVCKAPIPIPGGASGGPMLVKQSPPKPVEPKVDIDAIAAETLAGGSATAPTPEPVASPAGKPIVFPCEFCDEEISFPLTEAGRKHPCPKCSRIVKIPVPKAEKPKDWRTVEKAGPSLAAANQPAKIEDAWGTEAKKQVSQAALVDAGVVVKPVVRTPLADRIAVWVKRSLAAVVVLGLVYGLASARARRQSDDELADLPKQIAARKLDAKWPELARAELQRGVGLRSLLDHKKPNAALEAFSVARQLAVDAVPKGKVDRDVVERRKLDRDFFLIRLAEAQVAMGGSAKEVDQQERFDWKMETFREIQRTLQRIESQESRAVAVREMSYALAARDKFDLALSLASSLSDGRDADPVKAQRIALALAQGGDAKEIAPPPDASKGPLDPLVRAGYAEGYARKGKGTEAIQLANAKGDAGHRLAALVGVAAASHRRGTEADAVRNEALDLAVAIVEKEMKDRSISHAVAVPLVRLLAQSGRDAKSVTASLRDKAIQKRAEFEIVLVDVQNAATDDAASERLGNLDLDDRAAAWVARAAHRPAVRVAVADPDAADLAFLLKVVPTSAK